ncbi:MAG: hypothetical protein AAGI71_02090 [Bacteroidota bacterium]
MPNQTQSIVLGAAVVAILSTSYLGFINFLCCAGVIIGSMMAVWHYTSTHQLTLLAGRGALMGLIAAALGTFIAIFLNYALIQLGIRHDLAFTQWMLSSFGDSMPPDQYDQLVAQMEAPVTLMSQLTAGLVGVAVSAVFGAIGGAIGASAFKKGEDA